MIKQLLLFSFFTASALFSVSAQQKPRGTLGVMKESSPPPAEQAQAARWLKQNRSAFTENKGQFLDQFGKPNASVRYLLNLPGLNVQLRQSGFSYDTYAVKGSAKKLGFHRVDVELVGANPKAQLRTGAVMAPSVNAINGNGAFSNIRSYEKVTYQDIYPDIDLEFVAQKGTNKPIEYNFIVRPGGDASKIQLRYEGANATALKNERVVMNLVHGKLSERIPASWMSQSKKPVRVHYRALGSDMYAFNVPAYDKTQTLVIDPTPNLEWATYYGGTGFERIYAVDIDSEDNIYAVGYSASTANIASIGAPQGSLIGTDDGFIAKFNSKGQRLWGTYFGGTGTDRIQTVKFHNGTLYIAGTTDSPNLGTPGTEQPTYNGKGFIATVNATTGQKNWFTYVTNSTVFLMEFKQILIDQSGALYLAGFVETGIGATTSPGELGTTGTFRPTTASVGRPSFLLKYNGATGRKIWGTYLENFSMYTSIAMDADESIYVAGSSPGSSTVPQWLAYTSLVGGISEGQTRYEADGYLLKINQTTGQRIWGRYFGGSLNDDIRAITIDKAKGRIYVGGTAASTTGIASSGAYRTNKGTATSDGFWASFDLNGSFQQGSYLGAQLGALTNVSNIQLDLESNLILAGTTNTTTGELASECTFQPMPKGGTDLFLNHFNITSGQRLWGTYFGSSVNENFETNTSLTLNSKGHLVLGFSVQAGSTGLATPGSHQTNPGGNFDGVIAKFNGGELPLDFAVTPSTVAPLTQNACILGIPALVEGNAVGVTTPNPYTGKVFYQWQKSASATGPWEDLPGEVYKDLQPLASQTTLYYRRQIKVIADYCNLQVVDTSPVASVIIGTNAAPIASADGPQWFVCGSGANTVTLNGSATGGAGSYTYQWFSGSTSTGTSLSATASLTTPAVTSATTYTLQIKDAAGCTDIDQVTIVPAVANAGGNKSFCQGSGGVQIGTAPVASPSVTYAWSVVSGSALSSLSCTDCAQPIATPAAVTTYRLTVRVTQKNGAVCATTSDVTVTPVAAPNSNPTGFAGSDYTLCKNTSQVLGSATDASFAYTWTSGQYLSASQVAKPTFNAGTAAVTNGFIDYTVNAEKSGCVFVDQVRVSVLNYRITDQNETRCAPLWSSHLDEDNAPGTTYAWSVVSGTGSVLQTRNNGKDAYLQSTSGGTRFRRTVSLNGVSCTADVSVQPCTNGGNLCDFEILTLSDQSCPKVFGDVALRLGTNITNPADVTYAWSPANLVDNASASSVLITATAPATITLTIRSKYDASITCSKSIVINPPGWSLPVFNAPNAHTCPGTPVQIGKTPLSGFTYAWTPAEGLSSVTAANPTATVSSAKEFYVTITETATGCRNRDTVLVNVSAPVADAGRDRAVCNGATVTLGTPAPAGTSWTYAWSPANAAWTNGTTASSPQPQVQFAFATPQTYTLTVTDPQSGCTATDQVVLRNTVLAGEYAGAAQTTCQGVPVQLGREAEPLATYEWSPAAGLSCTTCASPTVTSPTATTTYSVRVSYPGCSTPVTDQVTVTVNPVSGLSLTDKTQCSGGVPIGYGAAGNPAAPSGATYLWAPATGLSCTTCANPTATVAQQTTYSVTVTLSSGCQFTDEVEVTPTAGAGSPVTLCPGESTQIGTAAITGATYSWTGAGIVGAANVAQPTVKPTTTTTYTVTVILSGCSSTSQVTVTVNTPADFAITGNTALCQGGATTLALVGTPAANTSWQWSPLTGVASPNATATVITPSATQTYRLTQTNLTTGCSNFKEVVVVVNQNTIAATTSDLAVCASSATPMPLTVTSSGSYTYVWSPATGLSNPFVAHPTVTTATARLYTVTLTDNTSKCQLVLPVNVTLNPIEACYPPVTLSGNVFHDANALTDVSVNTTSNQPIPSNLYVTLVDGTGQAVKTVAVGSNGAYDFGVTAPGNYSVVLHQTAAGSSTPSLPTGWINTGENLGAGVGSDAAVNGILTGITVASTNVTNANFGVQQPPVTSDKTLPSRVNPGGTTTVDLSSAFTYADVDGTPQTITFTQFPSNTTTVTINGTTYVPAGQTPGSGQSVWPGTVTVPVTNLSVLIDPVDGAVTSQVPFLVTDNGGATSNTSTVTVPFTTPTVQLSGNVYHDANALTDSTVNTTSQVAIPGGLYATLVNASNQAVATVPVNADGSYNFGNVTAGTYSVVLHQTSTGSTTPALPSGWINTGEHLGANAGSDGTVNGILPNITVATTDVTNVNFGVQQPPVTSDKTLPSRVNPGGTTPVNLSSEFTFSDVDGTPQTITFTQFPSSATTVTINGTTYVAPGQTPGSGQQVWPGTVTVPVTNLSVLVDPVDGDVTSQIPFLVTDNGGAKSNTSTVTVPFTTPQVTLSGNVYHDANGLMDNTVNTTSAQAIPGGLYATLVDSTGQAVKTVAVGSSGAYDFGRVTPATYSVVLHQTPTGSTTPSLPSGWMNTGEHLGASAGSDGTVNGILPNITVTTTDVTNANFGVQQPPVTSDQTLPSRVNPGGTTTVDLSSEFTFSDVDGSVSSITFTQFPTNVTTVTINGTTYVPEGQTPAAGQQVWPGTVTVPVTNLSVLVDPVDGEVTSQVPFYVTDNGGAKSNTSTVMVPFTTPVVSLSGNVFHDANGLTDNTVNSTSQVAIPTGLYATLVNSTGQAVKTATVASNGAYDFGVTPAGTYSVVLHQTPTGSTTPSLPSGWINTGEHLGANAGSDGTVNGILPNITVTTTDVTNANFGVQQPPVAQPKVYLIDVPSPGTKIKLDSSHVSTGVGTAVPGQLTGTDPEDGVLNGSKKDRTVTITTLPTNGLLWYDGVRVTPGQVIQSYDPSKLELEFTGTGYTSTVFTYAYHDAAGSVSAPVTYALSWDSPLPVRLTNFDAKVKGQTVELTWATAQERNSQHFEVQRSRSGNPGEWTTLQIVSAKGQSTTKQSYAFVDQQPLAGASLYRLKMVDQDGSFDYSRSRSVSMKVSFETSVYPNPASEKVYLKVSDPAQIKSVRLTSAVGNTLLEIKGLPESSLDVQAVPAGVYLLSLEHQDGSTYSYRVVIVK
ncbi:DUF7948 domain-containing protein [Siphonobacter curvatus]|uniref:Uncharacterized protein n=1 Tax=Siphonobacter curvatus TaxID=2094562 RepID=A0A2S7IJC7_9BACT|nr:T9SS type A sorting domain-containing protein [Siphonobacter curvatus]PQA56819.1 hypothetical protein C5O19_15880 [Siphonobacter curvatus]